MNGAILNRKYLIMEQLEQLIMAYQEQADKGILTDKGISYLEGLKRAKQLISLNYE